MSLLDDMTQPVIEQATSIYDVAWWTMTTSMVSAIAFCLFVLAFLVFGLRTNNIENVLRVFGVVFVIFLLVVLVLLRMINMTTDGILGGVCLLAGYWLGGIRSKRDEKH